MDPSLVPQVDVPAAHDASDVTPADPPTPDRASILVVDDRRANLVAMEALLAPLGRRVVLAESGEEALRLLLGERFALILLDVQMPGMDGFETARLIRGRLRTRRIPIIFVTAITSATSHMFDGYAAGAVDYLLKPVDPVILRSKVTLFVELFELNARLQREAARRGMEESLGLAQRAGLSGVWDWHLPSDRVRWSVEYADLVGLPAVAGGDPHEWLATVDPRDRDRVESRIADAVRTGGTWEEELRVVHPARGQRWLSARGRVYRDGEGEPERFIGIAMDVTERHQAEEDLRRLNATGERLAVALTRAEVVAEVVRQARGLPGVAEAKLLDPADAPGVASPADALVGAARAARRVQHGAAAGVPWVAMPLGGDGTVLALSRPRDEGVGEEVDAGFLAAFAAQCAQALERARLHDAERTARHEVEALQTASEALASAGGRQDVADMVVREAIRTFGAAAAGVRLLAPDGATLRTVAVGGFDDALARPGGASALDEDVPTVAALGGTALFAEDDAQLALRHPGAGGLPRAWPGLGALAALPLQLDERIVGVLGLRFQGPRAFRPDERNTLRAFARMAAMSLVRAGLHESEARRRAFADLLADVSVTLDTEMGFAGRVDRLRGLLVPRWADGCVITAPDAGGGMRAAIGAAEPAVEGVLRRGGPWTADPDEGVLLGCDDDAGGPFASLVTAGVIDEGTAAELSGVASGLLVAPIATHGRAAGAIALVFRDHPGRLLSELLPAEEIGRRVGIALENARLYEAQVDVATTLQRSLLPERLADVAGLELAARYQTATAHTEAGGDWYEAVEIPGGRVFLAVGDVVGRGTVAASVMGQLRSAMRAYALAGFRPQTVLEHLSRFAAGVPGAEVSTAVCVVIDPASGRVTYACAGHPHPVVVDGDGGVLILRGGRGPALGVTDRGYAEAETDLAPGASLLLFTDGLVERRSEPLEVGLERLGAAAAAERAEPAGVVADRVVGQLAGAVSSDDVALLIARRDETPAPLELTLPAAPDNLAAARAAVRTWLAAARIGADGVQDVVLAAGEALANAVEHGSEGDGSQTVRVEMRLGRGREVEVLVADEGGWRTPSADPGLRGQGIRIMRAVMDDVAIERGEAGTTVRMVRRPRIPPFTARRPPAGAEGAASVVVDDADPARPVAVVRGDIDAAGAATVGQGIRRACPADAHLRLDLGAVAYLDSSGVRLLVELAARQAGGGATLTVRVPAGGPVHRVLVLTGLEDATGLIVEET
ncbi:MAG: SpoIIE family protein phosphatase [Thermoleophilia bacterium]